MILPWTWYLPAMRGSPEAIEAYEEKDFKTMRRLAVKFWDVNHQRWCVFPDNFKEELYLKGVLQDATPPPAPKPPIPLLKPQQGELF
jgi:hypothetical protein